MRNAHSFLLKEKNSLRTIQTMVRRERSLYELCECCSLKDDPFLWKVCLARRGFTEKRTCVPLKREAFSSSMTQNS